MTGQLLAQLAAQQRRHDELVSNLNRRILNNETLVATQGQSVGFLTKQTNDLVQLIRQLELNLKDREQDAASLKAQNDDLVMLIRQLEATIETLKTKNENLERQLAELFEVLSQRQVTRGLEDLILQEIRKASPELPKYKKLDHASRILKKQPKLAATLASIPWLEKVHELGHVLRGLKRDRNIQAHSTDDFDGSFALIVAEIEDTPPELLSHQEAILAWLGDNKERLRAYLASSDKKLAAKNRR